MKTKTFVRGFSYSTANACRENMKRVMIDGRPYVKMGIEQAITLVGNLFKIEEDNKKSQYMLQIGMSRQHPNDTKCDKALAYEIAHENAFINPILTYYLQEGNIPGTVFNELAHIIALNTNKEFIRTAAEIKNNEK